MTEAAQIRRNAPEARAIEIVPVNPTIGAEIRKTRPAIVLQNDIANRHSPITIVAAITSRFHQPPLSDGSIHSGPRGRAPAGFRGHAQPDPVG